MTRILIVDDHAVVREGIKMILSDVPDVTVAAEARNGAEALEKIAQGSFDLVILDISMPGRSGLEILKQIKIDQPDLAVLVLSMHPEEQYGLRILRAGASGYLTKESAPEELRGAIEKVKAGRRYISPSLAERLAGNLQGYASKPAHEALSDREYEVLGMIAKGRTITEISSELNLSVKTVSTYRSRILEKLGLKSNADLIHYAIKEGLSH